MTLSQSLAPLLALALLAGCDKPARNDERSASGQVLQGTTSDAMLPLDKLKSQPPLLAPSQQKATPEGVADEQSEGADVAGETSAEPGEAVTPAPAPSPSSVP